MEVSTQINYKGCKAEYKVTSCNLVFFNAELMGFSGSGDQTPPPEIHFIQDNNHTVANSDVIQIAKDILKELNAANSFEHYCMKKN